MRRGIAVAAALLALPASAAAVSQHYFPKPHQGCRVGYARKVVKVKERLHGKTATVKRAECVVKRGATTSTVLAQLYPEDNNPNTYFDVSGTVYNSSGNELRGLPLTYKITDDTTRGVVATFAGSSNLAATCTVVVSLSSDQTVRTYTGQAVTPYQACNLRMVSMPAADDALITASFTGNSQLAPTTSPPQAFG